MDRFIALIFCIINGVLKSLKSNMDRFIDCSRNKNLLDIRLKSNMDRFIAVG